MEEAQRTRPRCMDSRQKALTASPWLFSHPASTSHPSRLPTGETAPGASAGGYVANVAGGLTVSKRSADALGVCQELETMVIRTAHAPLTAARRRLCGRGDEEEDLSGLE